MKPNCLNLFMKKQSVAVLIDDDASFLPIGTEARSYRNRGQIDLNELIDDAMRLAEGQFRRNGCQFIRLANDCRE